mmetsp:Transcript_5900/g.10670  ORF Transcript_5900/g.10670 Transcript_5900/m.10670 type:complete len:412 (+) Transcript_5900:77-1312(+)
MSWLFRSKEPKKDSTEALSQEARGTSQYGTLPHSEALCRRFHWHERGEPLQLLLMAVAGVGSQYAALAVITLTVYTSNDLFVRCNSREQPLFVAFACECTKSSMRSFVLLAMVVSLLIALRQIVRQRMYYEMLRRGVLLDFETVRPLHDPLFLLLTACLLLSLSHVLVAFWQCLDSGKSEKVFLRFLKLIAVEYLAPCCVFMALLFSAYDTENQLLPLSKYVEEDPPTARALLAQMTIVLEASAAEAVEQGQHIPVGLSTCTSDESLAALVAACEQVSVLEDEEGAASFAQSLLENARVEKYTRFVAEMWPARALLDPRIQDESSARFKRVWYAVNGCAIPLTFLVLLFFLSQLRADLKDVENGQVEDVGGMIVALVYFLATLQLLSYIWDLLFIPLKPTRAAKPAAAAES